MDVLFRELWAMDVLFPLTQVDASMCCLYKYTAEARSTEVISSGLAY